MKRSSRGRAFTLIELLVMVVILAIVVALLLPALGRARSSAKRAQLSSDERKQANTFVMAPPQATESAPPPGTLARVTTLDARIDLTPRLSVGTAEAESIYEAGFRGSVTAQSSAGADVESQLVFPLPPQLISLADLSFKINGEPSDSVTIQSGKLVWHGRLGKPWTCDKIKDAAFEGDAAMQW